MRVLHGMSKTNTRYIWNLGPTVDIEFLTLADPFSIDEGIGYEKRAIIELDVQQMLAYCIPIEGRDGSLPLREQLRGK